MSFREAGKAHENSCNKPGANGVLYGPAAVRARCCCCDSGSVQAQRAFAAKLPFDMIRPDTMIHRCICSSSIHPGKDVELVAARPRGLRGGVGRARRHGGGGQQTGCAGTRRSCLTAAPRCRR